MDKEIKPIKWNSNRRRTSIKCYLFLFAPDCFSMLYTRPTIRFIINVIQFINDFVMGCLKLRSIYELGLIFYSPFHFLLSGVLRTTVFYIYVAKIGVIAVCYWVICYSSLFVFFWLLLCQWLTVCYFCLHFFLHLFRGSQVCITKINSNCRGAPMKLNDSIKLIGKLSLFAMATIKVYF